MSESRSATGAAQLPQWFGLVPAAAIGGSWALLLAHLLSLDPVGPQWAWHAPLALVMTFLYTGLFITAHDAMHGTLLPGRRRLNDALGRLFVGVYACFSYRRLVEAHHRHHATPAVAGDPDWHDGTHTRFWPWYFAFMRRYVSLGQLAGMAVAYNALHWGLHVPEANLLLFWVAPSLLSTVQLFYFGTYRVHREPPGGHTNPHRATTSRFPVWLSFLSCYHFGLHLEHHEHPGVPWWRLPRLVYGARP